jgi:hypothetical protein
MDGKETHEPVPSQGGAADGSNENANTESAAAGDYNEDEMEENEGFREDEIEDIIELDDAEVIPSDDEGEKRSHHLCG